VPCGGSTLIRKINEKRKNLDHLFYIKGFGRLRLHLAMGNVSDSDLNHLEWFQTGKNEMF
jgi:hypothetical protein